MTIASAIPAVECRGLEVGYGSQPVLQGLDLAVGPGEAVALLGPSGSGKTTLLYAVAGFVAPRAGEVWMSGARMSAPNVNVPPERRSVGVVFQNYALWPHLTALENVGFPLRRRGMPGRDAERRARELLGLVGLEGLGGRRPAELSGGQQQRVGLARALAREPRLFLFDEPTAHLDMPLRGALLEELVARRRHAGAAALYATHDPAEALSVGDRVALLRDGRIVQIGTPEDVYAQPLDGWSARLTGASSQIDCRLERVGRDQVDLVVAERRITVSGGASQAVVPGPACAILRPDHTHLDGPLPGIVMEVSYAGPHTDYRLDTPAGIVLVRENGTPRVASGGSVNWAINRAWVVAARACDPDGPEGGGGP